MEKTYEKRRVEIYKNNEFIQCEMKDLEIGEIFRLFETPDFNELVADRDGNTLFKVLEKPYINDKGVWTVNADSAI